MLKPIDTQSARSWYEYLAEPRIAKLTGRVLRASGPRIAVVGNCQSFSVAYAMKLLRPTAVVGHFPVLTRSRFGLKVLARTLATYDYVFSHEFPSGFIPGGGSDELRDLLDKTMFIPAISFAAFHPDCVYVNEESAGPPVFSPLGSYHSALAVFAFRKGLSLEEANALFNENVFAALGYFDLWNASSAQLIDSAKQYGLDLSAEFAKWARRGIFMYTVNHPKPFVLVDLATKLLERLSLSVQDRDWEHYMVDDFIDQSRPVFPVYPPIGAFFGCLGSYTFRITTTQHARTVADYMSLPQFLEGSYKNYDKLRGARLANRRVDAWLADPATTDQIVSLAKENVRAGLLPVR
jgi:hypothetical protein